MEVKSQRNLWIYAFFASLLLLEGAREIIVINAGQEARPMVSERFFSIDGYTSVEGRWVWTDKDGSLRPQATRIDCYRNRGECFETGYNVFAGLNVSSPGHSIHSAQFAEDSITFSNTIPTCAETTTRIDLTTRETYRVRTRKDVSPDGFEELCDTLEPRMELQLAGYNHPAFDVDPLKGHFVPLASAIAWAFS